MESILAGYALVPAFLLFLWAVSRPLTAAVTLTIAAGLVFGVRRAWRLARCVSDCGGFSFELGGRVRITIAQTQIDDSS
ncbi:hypothetical protein [Natrinema amylolyticum]|uniref:hypothetical protein n=1 Tax=Natrinema amylolyticum TaxID=2878679 RepID=UPI001CFAFB73|nr:hypothetical protein [Natrinema amylolyticum]